MSFLEQIIQFLILNPAFLFIFIVWSLTLKGVALWMSAKRSQKNWFVAILILNTLGILEIFYIFWTRKKEHLTQANDHENNI